MRLLFGDDDGVSRWVADRIPHVDSFGECRAIGVMSEDGRALAGVVFHDYQPRSGTVQLSAAAESPKWASFSIVGQILAVPFFQYGVWKVWTATPHRNGRAVRFNKGIGFTQEAVLRDHFGKGSHAVICRMLAPDYHKRYLKENTHGQVRTLAASRA